jgi:hypothetical protein
VLYQRRIFATAALYFSDRRIGLLIVVGLHMSQREIPVAASGRQSAASKIREDTMTSRDPEADETIPT